MGSVPGRGTNLGAGCSPRAGEHTGDNQFLLPFHTDVSRSLPESNEKKKSFG